MSRRNCAIKRERSRAIFIANERMSECVMGTPQEVCSVHHW